MEIYHQQLDWLTIRKEHQKSNKMPTKRNVRTILDFMLAFDYSKFKPDSYWNFHIKGAKRELEVANTMISRKNIYHIDSLEYQRRELFNTFTGTRIKKEAGMTNIQFQGKYFLFNRDDGHLKVAKYFQRLVKKFTKKKRLYGKDIPRITRIDVKRDVKSFLDLEDLIPNFKDPTITVCFEYDKEDYAIGSSTGEIVTGITILVGETWKLTIYNKVLEAEKCQDLDKKIELENYIEEANLKDGESLYRIELRCNGGKGCAFIEPYFLNNSEVKKELLVNLVFNNFYKRHRVRDEIKKLANKSKLPENEKWLSLLFPKDCFIEAPKLIIKRKEVRQSRDEFLAICRGKNIKSARLFIRKLGTNSKKLYLSEAEDAFTRAVYIEKEAAIERDEDLFRDPESLVAKSKKGSGKVICINLPSGHFRTKFIEFRKILKFKMCEKIKKLKDFFSKLTHFF